MDPNQINNNENEDIASVPNSDLNSNPEPVSTPPPSMPNVSTNNTAPKEKTEDKSVGPIVGSIIVIVIVIIGGLYFWGARLDKQETIDSNIVQSDTVVENLAAQNTSDEIDSIENDLNATDFSDIDADLESIDAELGI